MATGNNEEWLPVAEAAQRLGITPRAVRKRCEMGNLRFRKQGNRGNRLEVQWEPEGELWEPKREPEEPEGIRGEPPPTRLEQRQQEEIAFLRGELVATRASLIAQLEQRDVAESEMRRLMLADREELLRLRSQLAITAAPETAEQAPEGAADNGYRQPWWRRVFGRREKA